jgi:hypothetical protein
MSHRNIVRPLGGVLAGLALLAGAAGAAEPPGIRGTARAGFAELQVGEDSGGFTFRPGASGFRIPSCMQRRRELPRGVGTRPLAQSTHGSSDWGGGFALKAGE